MVIFREVILFIYLSFHFMMKTTADSVLDFSFMVHRHGDRTPYKKHVNYSTNPEALMELLKPFGFSQLTENGKRRGYRLGQYIRAQYSSILASKFNETEVYLRSTDYSRTKMTILVALAAIYPPVVKWNVDLDWTPVPYTTVPVETDFNLPYQSCHMYKHRLNTMYTQKYDEMKKYNDVLDLVSKETGVGFDVRNQPLYISDIYNIFEDQMSLGLNLSQKVQDALPRIKEAADTAFNIIYSYQSNSLLPYICGVLLNEFINYANQVVNGKEVRKMRIYSAHHENVYAFSKITKTDISGMPPFASAFSLNLRRDINTKNFIVEPIYAHDAQNGKYNFTSLEVEGCGKPCFYKKFLELVRDNAWDYNNWRTKCAK